MALRPCAPPLRNSLRTFPTPARKDSCRTRCSPTLILTFWSATKLAIYLTDPMPPMCCTMRSEEHTSELQSRLHLVCRLLLEKKKTDMSYKSSDLQNKRCT